MIKIHWYTGLYLDTDHKIYISYRAKLISLYLDIHLPLQTQTVDDLQGQYDNIQSLLPSCISYLRKCLRLKAQMYLVRIVSFKLYHDMYRVSKSRILTPLDIICNSWALPVQLFCHNAVVQCFGFNVTSSPAFILYDLLAT